MENSWRMAVTGNLDAGDHHHYATHPSQVWMSILNTRRKCC